MLIRPVIYSLTRAITRALGGASIGFYAGQLFANGEQGVWYDPSDFSTLFQDAAGTIPVTAVEQAVGRILDKSGRGNHASQATAAARPVLSARKNLLTKSEQIDDAVWTKQRVTVVPNGYESLDKVVEDTSANNSHRLVQAISSIPATQLTFSMDMKAGERTFGRLSVENSPGTSSASVFVDLTNGVITSSGLIGTDFTNIASSIVAKGNGTYRVSVTFTNTVAGNMNLLFWLGNVINSSSYTGDGVSGAYVGNAQFERGPTATRYQRVTTATDYDSVGFPHYLKFDGVDDSLVTGAINFTATDKMTVWAGVTKLSDAAIGIVAELSVDSGANAGSWGLRAPRSALANYGYNSGGTLVGAAQTANTFPAPNTAVLTGISDIAGDATNIRVNTALTVGAGDQGTGNYGTYPLYIGRRGGATLPFNGQLNQLVVRGAASTNTQIEYCEDYIASKTGVTLP